MPDTHTMMSSALVFEISCGVDEALEKKSFADPVSV